jgi:catechol 2,3-dioxygenase-like lactoylglutathione lyase family enzyme
MTAMNHVGITVGDIDRAITWYMSVFELRLLAGPAHCDTTTAGAARRADVFGKQWGGMKLAHLATDNGAGIELFQFLEPPVEAPSETFPYWRCGTHHLAVTVTDFDGSLERLLSHGGRQRTEIHEVGEGLRVCYCEDPWGNVVEIVSKTYEELSTASTT